MVQEVLLEDPGVSETLDEMESLAANGKKFEKRRLRPLASHLDFDVSHRPTQAQDRVSKKRVYIGIALGIFLILLGFVSNFTLQNTPRLFGSSDPLPLPGFTSTLSASWIFVGLGVFLIITRLLLLFYGRDFFIGHKFAAVVIQKPFERSNRMADSLNGYLGVRYRSRIVNVLGLTSYTQHIIDLQHPNEAKTIPLYITNNGSGISRKWEELARQLDMPAIFNTADGVVEVALEDVQKAHPVMISEGKIPIDETSLYKVPHSFKIVEDDRTCQIDPEIRDSAFSAFSAVVCVFAFFMTALVAFILSAQAHLPAFSFIPVTLLATLLLIIVPASLFFRRRRLVISKDGIRIKSRWIFFPSFGYLIRPESLESINVIHNSYDLKYSLVIGADGQTTHIGRGLPKQDLEWLQNFINGQIKRFICK